MWIGSGIQHGNDACLGGRGGIPGREASSLSYTENSCQHRFGVNSKLLAAFPFLTHRNTCDAFTTLFKILFCSIIKILKKEFDLQVFVHLISVIFRDALS